MGHRHQTTEVVGSSSQLKIIL